MKFTAQGVIVVFFHSWDKKGPDENRQRGTILVFGAIFLLLLFMVAAVAVDLSRYFLIHQETQRVADKAALKGAAALDQVSSEMDESRAYSAILRYIERHKGENYRNLYEYESSEDIKGVEVAQKHSASGDTYYEVGVVAYSGFEPYFLPRTMFGDPVYPVAKVAVARVDGSMRKQGSGSIDCGVFANEDMILEGNNFNGTESSFCGNGDIDASLSNDGTMGDIYHLDDSQSQFYPPGGSYGEEMTYTNPKSIPDFVYSESSAYDVIISDTTFSSWANCPGGSDRKYVENVDGDRVKWSTGTDACVERTGPGEFEFPDNNLGQLQDSDGDSVGVYVIDTLHFTGSGNGIDGGLYATGNINVDANGYDFMGSPDKLGGLALWAEGDLSVNKNSVTTHGILGAEGDLIYGSHGGGTGPNFEGVAMTEGSFEMSSNSNNVVFSSARFERSALTGIGEWDGIATSGREKWVFRQSDVELVE